MIHLVANWKSHKTWEEAKAFLEELSSLHSSLIHQVICPPSVYLMKTADLLADKELKNIDLGAQDISPFPFGSYTGAVAAGMIGDLVSYAIVGHSERRRYFHETNQDVANKVGQALEHDITPIVCVDRAYIQTQVAALEEYDLTKLWFAYEPLEAIGSGVPEKPEAAAEVADKIKELVGRNVPVLYGGSVTAENMMGYLTTGAIDGILVGGASLQWRSWKEMVTVASNTEA